ncbi:DUF1850 domain-containing protein [Piscinibacter sakaiensis]|uniref:DUF1850 domain-containing protein n=1 Tax=Piscinibacter sakaiensis TaxID=1547922 RepID=UPI003AAB0A65
MSGICIASALAALSLAGTGFTLSWTHSVERIEWQEHWLVRSGQLLLAEARVKGSGAGMEPPPDAQWRDGWWAYRPQLPPQPQLLLAVSGATPSGWTLCVDGGACHDLEQRLAQGRAIDGLRIAASADCRPIDR